jgi:hypothetical protein
MTENSESASRFRARTRFLRDIAASPSSLALLFFSAEIWAEEEIHGAEGESL